MYVRTDAALEIDIRRAISVSGAVAAAKKITDDGTCVFISANKAGGDDVGEDALSSRRLNYVIRSVLRARNSREEAAGRNAFDARRCDPVPASTADSNHRRIFNADPDER